MDVYVDESGDLGFNKRSSRYFIVSYLFLKNSKKFRESFKWFYLRQKRKQGYTLDELKFSQSNDEIRKQALRLICGTQSCSYGIIVVNKRSIKKNSSFYGDSEGIYRYIIVSTVMNAIVPRLEHKETLKLVVDKRVPQNQRKYFEKYAISKGYQINAGLEEQVFSRYRLDVQHKNSKYEPCIQAADFLAGAEFQRFENRNVEFHDIIKDKMSEFRYWPS